MVRCIQTRFTVFPDCCCRHSQKAAHLVYKANIGSKLACLTPKQSQMISAVLTMKMDNLRSIPKSVMFNSSGSARCS